MSKQYLVLFARLAEPFGEDDVRFREGRDGGHYIKAPTAMNRLDSVLGPANWWDQYQILDEVTVECSLTIRLPDGSTLTKRDVGIRKRPQADGRPDAGASWKAAYSDAFKRAASKFGVARHLCKCGLADFVIPSLRQIGDGSDPKVPADPEPARPASPPPSPPPAPAPVAPRENLPSQGRSPYDSQTRPRDDAKLPRSGRALFAWAKDREQEYEVGLIKYLNAWGKLQDFPGRMVDWDDDQVKLAVNESLRKIESIAPAKGELYEPALAS